VIGTIIAALGGLAFCAIGVGAIVAPRLSSEQYGLPVSDRAGLALVRAVGARDIILGVITLALLVAGDRGALGLVLAVSVIAALADAAVVATGRPGAPAKTYAVHIVGGIALLVAWGLVRAGW
jgi:hypothetical protein